MEIKTLVSIFFFSFELKRFIFAKKKNKKKQSLISSLSLVIIMGVGNCLTFWYRMSL